MYRLLYIVLYPCTCNERRERGRERAREKGSEMKVTDSTGRYKYVDVPIP